MSGPAIHPSSLVESGAELGADVRIGPFCHVGADVVLEDGVQLGSHVVITGHTQIGSGTRVFSHAILGEEPQNVAYKGEATKLVVGRNNVIREGVTMHRGTGNARGITVVGDNCMFLAYAHVPHDCVIGNHVTLANNVLIGGHAEIGDRVIMGGGAGIHQFCKIGHHAFIGGMAAVVNDVIPYGLVQGNRAYLAGLNLVGMKRSGMERGEIHALRSAFRSIFHGEGSVRDNAAALMASNPEHASVRDMAGFILADSKRKFITPITARASRHADRDDE